MKVNGLLEKAQLESLARTLADDRIPGLIWRDGDDVKYDTGSEIKTVAVTARKRNAILSGNTDPIHTDTKDQTHPCLLYTSPSPRDS